MNGAVSCLAVATTLDSVGVYSRCTPCCAVALTVVYVFEIEGVDMTWEVPENCQQDIDEEIGAAAGNEEYSKRRDEQCDENQAKHRACSSHFDLSRLDGIVS